MNFSDEKVLIADDLPLIQTLLKDILVEIGYDPSNIDICDNGKDASDQFTRAFQNATPYSIAFFDVHMPILDGLEALKICRELDKDKKIPIIILTTDNEKDTVLSAVKLGASAYIAKPFDRKAIETKIIKLKALN